MQVPTIHSNGSKRKIHYLLYKLWFRKRHPTPIRRVERNERSNQMNKIIYLLPFLLLFLIPFWPDPDATAMFNSICLGASETSIPLLSQTLFQKIECSILSWKIFHIILLGLILFLLSRYYSLTLVGLVGFFPVFLLTLEDDLFAFPLFFLYFVWAQKRIEHQGLFQSGQALLRSLESRLPGSFLERLCEGVRYKLFPLIVGVLLTIFLGLFVWKGSFLIGLILITYFIAPYLSILPSLIYIVSNGFNTWGGSAEAAIGNGFVIGQIGLFFILWKFSQDKIFRKEYWLLLSLGVLTFFQPKWGEWIVLPLLPLLNHYFQHNNIVKFIGVWLFVLIISFTVLTSFPSSEQVMLFQKTVELQHNGLVVYNDWGVGHYLEYYGGTPTNKGGYSGKTLPDSNFYWFGPKIIDCNIISYSDALFLQKC